MPGRNALKRDALPVAATLELVAFSTVAPARAS